MKDFCQENTTPDLSCPWIKTRAFTNIFEVLVMKANEQNWCICHMKYMINDCFHLSLLGFCLRTEEWNEIMGSGAKSLLLPI